MDNTFNNNLPATFQGLGGAAYVQDIYMDQSLLLADAIQQQFKTRIATSNRGVKQAGLLVLRQSSMPSVLVETGFLSNNAEANYLNSDDGQQNIALSILEAFRKFKAKNSGGSSETPVKSTSQNKQTEVTPKPNVTENSLPEEIQKPKPVVKNNGRFSENEDSIHKTAVASTKSNSVSSSEKKTESNTYYSVQIGATLTPEEPTAANFNGLKDIRREKTDKYYRFYIGKEVSIEQITPIWKQIKKKIPNAFIVSFVDGKRIVVKN